MFASYLSQLRLFFSISTSWYRNLLNKQVLSFIFYPIKTHLPAQFLKARAWINSFSSKLFSKRRLLQWPAYSDLKSQVKTLTLVTGLLQVLQVARNKFDSNSLSPDLRRRMTTELVGIYLKYARRLTAAGRLRPQDLELDCQIRPVNIFYKEISLKW